MKKIISMVLLIAYLTTMLPMMQLSASAAEPDTYTLSNNYVSVVVASKNGGFTVQTAEGNKLVKSDNNKKLLYHSDEYDTSFTSFQVTYPDGKVKDYIFGGDYSFLGLGSNNLTTVQDSTGITSTWTVDKLTFTQRIELSNSGAKEHGMAALSYKVVSARTDTVSIKQRLLLDTSLGSQDFAYYEMIDSNNNARQIEKEQIIETKDYIPLSFSGYDDPNAPNMMAYTINSTSSLPYQVAFAHWNNLAATAFEFVPDNTITFTNKDNLQYQTADSAYALYYDMGSVTPKGTGNQISTSYGVYSNLAVAESSNIAVNVVSPLSLTLSGDKKAYQKTQASLPGKATFSIQTQLENYTSSSAKDYDKVTVAFYTSNGIEPLDGSGGAVLPTPTYQSPYTVDFMDFSVGQTEKSTFYFKADVGASSTYRKVEMHVFDTSKSTVGSESNLVKENLIGSYTFYVLCPGGDGQLPKVTFTGSDPKILYQKGTRHLYITGNNLGMLNGDKSQYTLYAYNTANASIKYKIPSENILFPEENLLDIVFSENMVPGSYELQFELTDTFVQTLGSDKILKAPALTVVMSDDLQYQNIYYGIVAVVQKGINSNAKYLIKSYKNEEAFNQDKSNYDEILVTLRGDFIKENDGNGLEEKYTATSLYSTDSSGNNNVQNLTTVNNCIDFEGGTLSVYYKYENGIVQSVYIDFDGSLYTSVERTSIWKGKAALTEIKNGQEFGLVPYNSSGTKLSGYSDTPITLIWPNAMGLGQTIAGMVCTFTYGSLGVMYNSTTTNITGVGTATPVMGNVLSFSAALDLGFLIPKSKTAKANGGREINAGTELYWISQDASGELRGLWNNYYEQTKKDKTQSGKAYTQGQASVIVDNILFGCGKGYIGVKFSIDLALPAYIDAMPSIQGKLSVNTINDWSFGIMGKCEFTTISLEVDLKIKSYNNIPVPDKLYFYVEGFEPGLNIDGFGVLWITGGGGGIDNIYDTIFSANGVPPLKLLLSVSFDVFKVLSARADLSLSLRGIGLSVSGVKIKATNIKILDKLQLQFDWYPDIYFLAAVDASFYGIIRGQGYIVVIDNDYYNGFFEGFIRGSLIIPSAIPFIGGTKIAQVDFGINNSKIWGSASVIGGIGVSVVYYWGGDVDVSLKKGSAAQPTFPELLGCDSIPVYYDEETGKTLYMSIGNNLELAAAAEVTDSTESLPKLLASGPTVFSTANKEKHIVNAGTYTTGKKYVYTASFSAPSLEEAKAIAANFSIKDKNNAAKVFSIELYSEALNNLATANANLTYDPATKIAALGVCLTKPEDFNTEWEILTTGVSTDIVLFEAGSIPQITDLHGTFVDNNKNVSADWDGVDLDKLDSISFYLTDDATGEAPGNLIATIDAKDDIVKKNGTFVVPANLPSGKYYLRAVYSQEDVVNGVKVSSNPIVYDNAKQPSDPSGVTIANSGDLTFDVALEGNTDVDGYLVSVYDVSSGTREVTDITNMSFEKKENVLPPISVGGSYKGFDMDGKPAVHGLIAGKNYQVGVTSYNYVDADGDGNSDYILYGQEVVSASKVLKAITQTAVEITAKTPFTTIRHKEWGQDKNGKAAMVDVSTDTFKTADVTFGISSDSKISGVWSVDDLDYSGDIKNLDKFDILLTGLSEGTHTLNISGEDEDGDSFRKTKVFVVDTKAPKLLLSSPVNGSCFYENGKLDIKGITDQDARFTIESDGVVLVNSSLISELSGTINPDGVFALSVNVDPSVSSHHIKITVSDQLGNSYSTEADLQNLGLSHIDRLSIYANGIQYTNQNLKLSDKSDTTAVMSLVAETGNGSFIINDPSMIHWEAQTVNGSADINDEGILSISSNSVGYVTGGLKVSNNASMTASSTFGADIYNKSFSKYVNLTLGTTVGGTVTGSGRYLSGTEVNISAIPHNGYQFTGWTVEGNAVIANKNLPQTTITIPEDNVTVTAGFKYVNQTVQTGSQNNSKTKIPLIKKPAKAGEKVSIAWPYAIKENNVTVCVMKGDVEYVVPLSMISNGNLIFIAPVEGEYYLKEAETKFTDAEKHWAKEHIGYVSTRGLFSGVKKDVFDPNGQMTRAMFVTVLGKLHGIDPSKYTVSSYKDVQVGKWYAPYVEWASQSGIISGIGNGIFGTDSKITREQMCVMIEKYTRFAEYNLVEENLETAFKDSNKIHDWAKTSVEYAKKNALVSGIGNNLFNPLGNATRAEVSAIFKKLIIKIIESK